MEHHEYTWKSKTGSNVFGQSWLVESPKAVVGIIHGMGEHSGRYNYVVDALNNAGISVVAYDQFGHGRTEGKRGCCVCRKLTTIPTLMCLFHFCKGESHECTNKKIDKFEG